MKSRTWTCIFAMALLAALLAFPIWVAAQDKPEHNNKHHHYKFIDLGTFGGPNSGVSIEPWTPAINSGGRVAGTADTAIPTSAPACYNPVAPPDCFRSHAFAWRGGALQDLGTLPGGDDFSYAFAINQGGQIVGTSENGQPDPDTLNPEFHAVLWDHGNILDLGTFGGVSSFAADINDRGQVVGPALNAILDPNSMLGLGSNTTLRQTRGFLWEHGRMQDLGTLGGTDTWPVYVNDRGQVAGTSYTSDSIDPNTGFPPLGVFLWENGTMKNLGDLGGDNGLLAGPPFGFASIVFGLNNRGQVTGTIEMPGNQTVHAFLWNGEKLEDLGTLGGSSSFAFRINEKGEVVGNSFTTGDNGLHSFITQRGVMVDLGTAGGFACNVALAINNRTQVVGALTSAVDGCSAWRGAFLWENGGPMVDLSTLIPADAGLKLFAGFDINDRGEIVGGGMDPSCTDSDHCDSLHAFALIPCDENHPGIEGCDYSMVETSAAVPQTSPAVRDASSRPSLQSILRRMNRYRFPGSAFGPRN